MDRWLARYSELVAAGILEFVGGGLVALGLWAS